jgi:hypothetical protein
VQSDSTELFLQKKGVGLVFSQISNTLSKKMPNGWKIVAVLVKIMNEIFKRSIHKSKVGVQLMIKARMDEGASMAFIELSASRLKDDTE